MLPPPSSRTSCTHLHCTLPLSEPSICGPCLACAFSSSSASAFALSLSGVWLHLLCVLLERRNGQDGDQKPTSKIIEVQKDVMRSRDEKLEENLQTIQKVIEDAAGKVAHSRKHERETCKTNTGECENTRRSRRKVHKSDQKKSVQETSEESQSGTPG